MSPKPSDTDTVESDLELLNAVEGGFDVRSVNRLYVCLLCDFDSTGLHDIVEHIQSHSRASPWDCWRCAHVMLGENGLNDEPHDPRCPDQLEDDSDGLLDDDLETIKNTGPNEEHKCTLCPYKSTLLYEVVNHISDHLRKKKEASDPLATVEESRRNWDNVYTCTECEFSCIHPKKLEKHMETHEPDAKFKCRECNQEVISRLELQRHKRRVHGFLRPFECTLCPAKFTRMDNLRAHVKTHTGEQLWSCTKCSFTSPNRARLVAHYDSHKDGHPIRSMGTCPACGRSFVSYQQLETHRRTHVLRPPYVCSTCGEILTSGEELFEHHSGHVDASATTCFFCDFKCFDGSTMNHHLGTAHGPEKPFECDTCNYRFSSKVHWTRHQLVHTGLKPYQCELCLARFSQAGNRKAHMLKIHKLFIPLARGRHRIKDEMIVVRKQ
uniref:Zinc finger protein 605 n=1 Tax=Lygus hesperus TaxID=30085 RepID=A0A146LRD7_LYGHE